MGARVVKIIIILLLLSACYPLSVTRMKWRIHWDKDLKRGKKNFLKLLNKAAAKSHPIL